MPTKVKIAPSILSADFANLASQIKKAEEGGADLIHVDVMDGHFVPNITIGPAVVAAVARAARVPLDVHLMIDNPERYVDAFIDAGASALSFHVEATPHAHRLTQAIKARGVDVGIALNPATAAHSLTQILTEIDFVLVMSVNPGFGGQEFIPEALSKVAMVRDVIEERDLAVDIEVDGGVSTENAKALVEAGAGILVAGASVFMQADIPQAVRDIRKAAEA